MKKNIALWGISMLLGLSAVASATNLNPGDLVITTVNVDSSFSTVGCPNPSSTNNLFSFVNRVDLSTGTVVYFTDNARSGSVWRVGEGTIVFTATNLIPAGTTTYYNDCSPGSDPLSRSRVGGFDPATAGDTIIAYQGSGVAPLAPDFIYGIGWSIGNPWITSGVPNSNTSHIPAGLLSGSTAIFPTTLRNAKYMCTDVDLGSTGFLASLASQANWTGSSTTGMFFDACPYIIPFDVSVQKTQVNTGGLSAGFARVGQIVTYQLTLQSVFGLATNVQVQDILPVGFVYVSHSSTSGDYVTGSGLWTISSIASGVSEILTITGSISATGSIINTGSLVSFSGTDQNGTNNIASVSVIGIYTTPTAIDDVAIMLEDGTGVVIDVLQNDIPGSGVQMLSITGVTMANSGVVSIVGTGISYVPSADFCGVDMFTYRVMNQFSEISDLATGTVTVTCVNDLPMLTVLGLPSVTIYRYTPYVDSGATAVDLEDGDISGSVVVSGSVLTGTTGSYILHYAVVDSSGGIATGMRMVHVIPGDAPMITLIGSGNLTQSALLGYADPGAIYSDLEDGTGVVTNISGVVITGVIGTYLVTYDYTDMQGNPAIQVVRTVNLIAPICDVGQELSISTGNVPSCLLCAPGSFNAMTGGSCIQCAPNTFTDLVGSASCNACPMGMTSTTGASVCMDTIAPVVTLRGATSLVLMQGGIYTENGATWIDGVDGTGVVGSPFSGIVNILVPGTYELWYRYVDVAGNTGNIVSRTVTITSAPLPELPQSTGLAFGGGGGGAARDTYPTPTPSSPITPTPMDAETFNPTITGLCYQRKTDIVLTGSSSLSLHATFPAALRFLASYELTKYNAIDAYRPLDFLTREESAKLFTQYARNVLCRQPNTETINYSDIASADQTLVPYITLAYQLTLMHGDAVGTFRPLATISKPEFLAVLVRTILFSYLDETSPQRYAAYEQVGKDLSIITQDIDPLAKGISRHDAALMLFRAYRYQQYGTFDKGYETYILKDYEEVVQKYK